MIKAAILNFVISWAVDLFTKFGAWIIGGAAAMLAFLFSSHVRKYTIVLLAAVILLGGASFWGWQLGRPTPAELCRPWAQIVGNNSDTFSKETLKKLRAHNATGVRMDCWEPYVPAKDVPAKKTPVKKKVVAPKAVTPVEKAPIPLERPADKGRQTIFDFFKQGN